MIFNLNSFTQSGGGENNMALLYSLIVVVVFFVLIMPMLENCYKKEKEAFVAQLENAIMPLRIDTNKCSRSCCKNSNWALPTELVPTDMSKEESDKYIATNLSCNFGSQNGGGCVCVSKNDYEILGSRGGNGVTGCNK